MTSTPFVVGQWVRGERFYGRRSLIEEILDGERNWLWLLGIRRIGKTSLLRQVEHLTADSSHGGYFPLYWDFQGADSEQELHSLFSDALLDAEPRLEQIDVSPAAVEGQDLFRTLGQLRRKLRARNLRLLLLCDEVEELVALNKKEPALLRHLRGAMQSAPDIRSVLASTINLWKLTEQETHTSPFLHGFAPPLYIPPLSDEAAGKLIRQANLPSDSRPRFDKQAVEIVRTRCDNHPYLIQLLCKRFHELGDLEEATEQVATDPMVSYFFAVDFKMLSDTERSILHLIARSSSSTSNSIQDQLGRRTDHLSGLLFRLQNLGYLRRNDERRFVLANYFFRRWFTREEFEGQTTARFLDTRASGQSTTASDGTRLGRFDGRYDLIERVGQGATGSVYKAYDGMIRTTIAIKALHPEYSRNPEAVERFRQETLLARDIGHPNILRVYHLGDCEGQKYLTMKWIDGPALSELIKSSGGLSPDRVIELSTKIVSALAAAHAGGIIHRDIKPGNVLLDDRIEPYLTDFGLARLQDKPGITESGVFLGTPDYASPEQARLEPIDARADLYTLGLLMFEMLTGKRPFVAESISQVLEMHRNAAPPDPRELRVGVPDSLAKIVLRCLEKHPAGRYQSAGDLGKALQET